MSHISELDKIIEENVREFELSQLRRKQLNVAEREELLTKTLGPTTEPRNGELFVVGDTAAGITSKSAWFQFRRIHFATIVSIAVGELREGDRFKYCVDINCTIKRSYRIGVPTILDADNFLVVLSQFMSFKIVPTVEEEIEKQRKAEELAAANDADAERRHRRMEFLAIQQQQLLNDLIQVECAPRVSFGMIF